MAGGAGLEPTDVRDGTDGLLGPDGAHAHAGLDVSRCFDRDGVQQRSIGAIEHDLGEGKRCVEGLPRDRLRHPGPALDEADIRDGPQFGDGVEGDVVILRRRHSHGAVGQHAAENLSAFEAGHESGQRGSERPGVVELDQQGGVQRAGRSHEPK